MRSRTQDCTTRKPTILYFHVALILFVLWYCAMLYSYCQIFFETMDRLIRRLSSCFAYDLNRYDVMRTQPQECTRRTHAVSCGWTNVHDMMHNESYIRTQRTSTSKLLHAPCSYKHWAATASLLLGIFFGFIWSWNLPLRMVSARAQMSKRMWIRSEKANRRE